MVNLNTTERTRSRSRFARRGFGRLGLVLLGVFSLLLMWFVTTLLHSTRLRISPETTHIVEPLTVDGKQVDYFAAIEQEAYSAKIATEENGYRLLVDHMNMWSDAEPWQVEQLCQKLGLDCKARKLDVTFQEPYEFLTEYVAGDEFDGTILKQVMGDEDVGQAPGPPSDAEQESRIALDLSERLYEPWTLDDLPIMEEWLRQNSPALDLVGEAVRQPLFQVPRVRQSETNSIGDLLLGHVQEMRSFARGLAVRANFRRGSGDAEGAMEDFISCKRLGRHVGNGVWLVESLVGIAIEGIADSLGYTSPPTKIPHHDQLQQFAKELNALPPRISFDQIMRFERYYGLSMLQRMAHGGTSLNDELDIPGNSVAPGYLRWFAVDWNVVMQGVNERYDAVLEGRFTPQPPSFNPLVIVSRRARSKQMAKVFGQLLVPALRASREAMHRGECCENMQRITLAMLMYHNERGSLPPAYTVDSQGKALHSWRVLLLPYLGQQQLYAKIRLDEPWDSEHNRQFHGQGAPCFQCPSVVDLDVGQTTYSVVCGPEMPFEAAESRKLTDYGMDRRNLILVVERADPVCWMDPNHEISQEVADNGIQPSPYPVGEQKLVAGEISSPHPGGINVGLRSGGVEFVSQSIVVSAFQKLLRGTEEVTP
jgi:hypothetical protein